MKQRYYSLDVFRGATVCLMILVNNPGSWAHIYSPLDHAPWHGLTPTDLVFPFFLFAVGNAMAFVMPRLEAGGDRIFWKKVIKRTLLIFGIGLFLNWWPFSRWENNELVANGWTWVNAQGKLVGVRIFGVLQRIAVCYFFASVIIYYAKARGSFLIGGILLLLYWLLCVLGNPADPYSLSGWFGTHLDLAILHDQHMYHGERVVFDPEGLGSTLPAIVQVILGYLVGDYIIKRGKAGDIQAAAKMETISQASQVLTSPTMTGSGFTERQAIEPATIAIRQQTLYRTLTGLFIVSVALLVTGYIWNLNFPVNKKIWTSSYVVTTTGLAIAVLSTLIYAIELKGIRGWWTRFFDVFGKNALFVFALSAFLPKGLRLIRIPNGINPKGEIIYGSPWTLLYDKIYKFIPGAPEIGSLCFALTVIAFMWAICYALDKKGIYIKV
ncbi:MAG: acyltransferase family protein [Mucilaginibacter sp.]